MQRRKRQQAKIMLTLIILEVAGVSAGLFFGARPSEDGIISALLVGSPCTLIAACSQLYRWQAIRIGLLGSLLFILGGFLHG